MDNLHIEGVSVTFPGQRAGEEVHALEGISLTVEAGAFVVVVGSSGCGKTTLLNLMAGFISPSSGEILLGDKRITAPGPDRGVVFQKHALLPWLNVIENVEFGLDLQGVPKAKRREIAAKNLALVGLQDFQRHAIYQLSGGMQQRVGIARALTSDPAMLLMDEPMAALDALTRETIQELLLDVWSKTQKMIFFITHSVEEALFMATRLIVMSPRPGRITHSFDLDFQARFLRSRDARAVKSDPDFIRMRETVLGIIYGDGKAIHAPRRLYMNKNISSSVVSTTQATRRLFLRRSVAPGEQFGAPGQGSSKLISALAILALFLIWFAVTEARLVKPLFLPSPSAVLEKFILVTTVGFANSTLFEHTVISLYRVFGAFFLACITAIPIGVMMGVNRIARGIFDPPIEFYRPLPPLAYLPLVIIWFGIGEFSKVLLIYLAIFAPMAISARAGVRSVAIEQIHAAYSMGATASQVVWRVILKSALPEIFTGMRIGIGVGWTTLVAGEMVASTRGIGFMVLNAAEFLASDVVIVGIIVIGVFAFSFDLLMRYLERLLIPWKGKV